MPRYSREFKETIVQKMMPPNAQSIAQIHRDTGVSEPTLYNWTEVSQFFGAMNIRAD
ncbi:transposase [Thiolapillus sp.]|uniref:transposase n=1 Tax=Thiolapillus sp. TaxID=2017437 RepID=UPI003AF42256